MRKGMTVVIGALVFAAVAVVAPLGLVHSGSNSAVALTTSTGGTSSPNVIVRPIWD